MQIIYEPIEGKAIPDGKVEEEYNYILNNYELLKQSWVYSTENIIQRLRLGRLRGEIDDLTIIFNDERLEITEYGSLLHWPNGFCDYNINICQSILLDAMSKHKVNKLMSGG